MWIVAIALSLVGITAASSAPSVWDLLQSDLDAWEQEAVLHDADAEAYDRDMRFYESDVLFPFDPSLRPSSQAGSASSARSSASSVIHIEVDGKSIMLQDVPTNSWFAPYVAGIAKRQLISGYRDHVGKPTGRFGPDDQVTVGQLLKVLILANGDAHCAEESQQQFARQHWAIPYLRCAEDRAWSLVADARLQLDRPATRAEVVGTLLEALHAQPAIGQPIPFEDVRVSTPYANAIAQAHRSGVINGYQDEQGVLTGRFGPHDPVTRAEFAKIVMGGLMVFGS